MDVLHDGRQLPTDEEIKMELTELLKAELEALARFLAKDLWEEIDDTVTDINQAKHLHDIIENVLDGLGVIRKEVENDKDIDDWDGFEDMKRQIAY